jgi:DNA-binding transcriptional MerR regulator
MLYRTQHLCTLFNVAPETARIWALEFAEYLSPTATPGKNKHRLFTEADMTVFSLVAELKKQGMTFADVHAALKSGQRGSPPKLPPEEVQAIVATDRERRLTVENDYLQQALLRAQEELKQVEALRTELQQTKERSVRLEAQLDALKTQQERLEAMVKEFARELGREYARGFTDGLREKRDLDKPETD